ncbi:ladinin-1 [Megalops cyprinoides]|uniref:ladinin-1 n=1 Tax=Megalops cyprinoides TaxID=118141 RepID=UPI001864C241|nr:ladinin-1 [Megalops cyprinoides]
MSIGRNAWSALSSMARQWTMEDEEEIERERRRKTRTFSTEPEDGSTEDTPSALSSMQEGSEVGDTEPSGFSVDFVEMLRVRDERRRRRHVETLTRQREEEEGQDDGQKAQGGGDREKAGQNPDPPTSPVSSSASPKTGSLSENGRSQPDQDANTETPKKPSGLFVSSLSVSFDKSPTSPTERGRVVSPLSPTGSFRAISPEEHPSSPVREVSSPVTQNGQVQGVACQNGSPTTESVTSWQQTEETPFQRQTSRTVSFRTVRKIEEPSTPLQRSASVRITSKTQASKTPNEGEEKQSPFQRNSRQRISSRTIQEKMERLAMAVQRSENVKPPSVSQKGMYVLVDEVSRKRGLFERFPEAEGKQQDWRSFSVGISERINRWVTKAQGPGSPITAPDLRHVDITSKRSIWENRAEEVSPKPPNSKVYK